MGASGNWSTLIALRNADQREAAPALSVPLLSEPSTAKKIPAMMRLAEALVGDRQFVRIRTISLRLRSCVSRLRRWVKSSPMLIAGRSAFGEVGGAFEKGAGVAQVARTHLEQRCEALPVGSFQC